MAEKNQSDLPTHINFHYIKNSHFRTIHTDGAIGGITPRGLIHIALYSERPAIPQLIEQALTDEGKLGDVVSQSGREGVVRELDVDVILSRQAAIDIRDWLTQRVEELDQLRQTQGAQDDSESSDTS